MGPNYYVCEICEEPFETWGDCWDCDSCNRKSCCGCFYGYVKRKCDGDCMAYELDSEEESSQASQASSEELSQACICHSNVKKIRAKDLSLDTHSSSDSDGRICEECFGEKTDDKDFVKYLVNKAGFVTKKQAMKSYLKNN